MASDGRWGGRLASRPLPEHDPASDGLDEVARTAVVRAWLGRSAAERRASDAFVVIHRELSDAKADPEMVALAKRALDEGREVEPPPRLELAIPQYPDAARDLVPMLHVIAQCVLNETTASAFLEAALRDAGTEISRAALRELLSDDIDHARIGWALLAATSEAQRARIDPWLVPLLRSNLRMWRLAQTQRPELPLAAHGIPSSETVEAAIDSAMRDIVLPGLAHVGFEIVDALAFLDSEQRQHG